MNSSEDGMSDKSSHMSEDEIQYHVREMHKRRLIKLVSFWLLIGSLGVASLVLGFYFVWFWFFWDLDLGLEKFFQVFGL